MVCKEPGEKSSAKCLRNPNQLVLQTQDLRIDAGSAVIQLSVSFSSALPCPVVTEMFKSEDDESFAELIQMVEYLSPIKLDSPTWGLNRWLGKNYHHDVAFDVATLVVQWTDAPAIL